MILIDTFCVLSVATTHAEMDWDRLKQDHTLLQQHHQNTLLYTSELEEKLTKLSSELESTVHSVPAISLLSTSICNKSGGVSQ